MSGRAQSSRGYFGTERRVLEGTGRPGTYRPGPASARMVKQCELSADKPAVSDFPPGSRGRGAIAVEEPAMSRAAIPVGSPELDTARESLSILATIADYHDDDTSQHAERVGLGAALIARTLGLPEPFVNLIRDAAPLHDIGKVGISRRILLKPGKLTPAEWMHMMRHVDIGAQILASARSPVLRLAAEIARTHHERWDGNGYTNGLMGEEIPLAGRITALADVWDTLTHERPYKEAWDEDRALTEITNQAGAHFDPQVVAAFLTIDRRTLNDPPAVDGAERAA
jgi:putative two-component system response regulator